ncbi:MAG: TIR domain-containing protein, partial [Anaerolineae bacterium]|nr:TIR domain-containing protein [Anaerolineae bacterium]
MHDEPTIQHDVFISYARRDGLSYAEDLERDLCAAEFAVWRDKRDLDPDQDFTAELEKAIEHSARVVCIITPDVKRDNSFVRREIGYALAIGRPVIPLIFADTVPPIHIVNVTREDFTHAPWSQAVADLIARLRRGTDTADQPITPPDDPFRDYLNALYQQIVRFLNHTVFSEITLYSASTPGAVQEQVRRLPALPVAFAAAAGMEENDLLGVDDASTDEVVQFANFRDAYAHFNERVLLLGEPGAGKTTTLMAFARDAVSARLADPTLPLPILAIVATWDSHAQTPLVDWLDAQNTALTHDKITNEIDAGRALLLLDGLDELGAEREEPDPDDPEPDPEKKRKLRYDPRQRFLAALQDPLRSPDPTPALPAGGEGVNARAKVPPPSTGEVRRGSPSMREAGRGSVIVTSRVKDYAAIDAKIVLDGAVTLHPLNDAQMRVYLTEMPDLWAALENDDDLREVARTPLLLSLFTFAYRDQGEKAAELRDLRDSPHELREAIFRQYVERRYAHEQRKINAELPFTLDELWTILGEVAFQNAAGGYRVEEN